MKTITITWKAFTDRPGIPYTKPTDVTIAVDMDQAVSDYDICEVLFRETNLYEGPLWNRIEPLLSQDRTHTALSVGDEITIDNKIYRCENIGWNLVTQEETP